MGVDLPRRARWPYRCNLVTRGQPTIPGREIMVRLRPPANITSEAEPTLIVARATDDGCSATAATGVRFHSPASSTGHLCGGAEPNFGGRGVAFPPHDPHRGKPDRAPEPVPAAAKLNRAHGRVRSLCGAAPAAGGRLDRHADLVWWGPGHASAAPPTSTRARHGVRGADFSSAGRPRARPPRRGCRASRCSNVARGATAGFDKRLRSHKRETPALAVARRPTASCFLLHVEATDEAGHQGAIDEKVHLARAVGMPTSSVPLGRRGLRRRAVSVCFLAARTTPTGRARPRTQHVGAGAVPALRHRTFEGRRPAEYTRTWRGRSGWPVPAHDLMARRLARGSPSNPRSTRSRRGCLPRAVWPRALFLPRSGIGRR